MESIGVSCLELFSECCEYYGWTLEYAMNMDSKQFFAMLRIAVKNRRIKENNFLHELTYIAATPSFNKEYRDELAKLYKHAANGTGPKDNIREFNNDSFDEAARIMQSVFTQKARLDGVR